ncbi:uncharacterized protein LOC129237456 [Anastrepha obliqua]|uniref:uncharacterized protein LOC129237456 n=1 Tax=Anastrepha obliqua TaxID=95512 RepID=UPI002409058F|nr:uncharacterized protein LOC129237456 [Anastrepha obliqua]
MYTNNCDRFVSIAAAQQTQRPLVKGRQQRTFTLAPTTRINTSKGCIPSYSTHREKCRRNTSTSTRAILSYVIRVLAANSRSGLFGLLLVFVCTNFVDLVKARAAGMDNVAAATLITTTVLHANHKQNHRSAMLYARNNFTDLSEISSMDLIDGKGGSGVDIDDSGSMPDVAVPSAARTPDPRTNAATIIKINKGIGYKYNS